MCYNENDNKYLLREPRKSLKLLLVQIFFETQEYEVGIPSNQKSSRLVNTVTSLVHTARKRRKEGASEDFSKISMMGLPVSRLLSGFSTLFSLIALSRNRVVLGEPGAGNFFEIFLNTTKDNSEEFGDFVPFR